MFRLVLAVFFGVSLLSADITVAAAASYKNALTEVAAAYKGAKVQLSFASSGKLLQQIQAGAPFDVFMSADMKYPLEAVRLGLTDGEAIATAENRLVLWAKTVSFMMGARLSFHDVLLDDKIKKIAIANPKTAPLGAAAVQALKNAKIYDAIEHKLVVGDNAAQTTTFIESGAAEIGITGYSLVADQIAAGAKNSWALIDPELYDPLIYGTVLLKSSKNKAEALEFIEFLRSETAEKIFVKHGLSVVK